VTRIGSQVPRVEHVPPAKKSAAGDVVEMARIAGMELDPWQVRVLEGALGEDERGRWAAFEAALVVPRQAGKSALLEALVLTALFVWQERTVIFSAHLFSTAAETFQRLRALIEGSEFADEVAKVYTANGKEAIILKNGCRVKFMARSRGGGRGFSGDRIIFDEAFDLDPKSLGAMVPTLAARSMRGDSNPQIWYASSAPHSDSVVLHGIRSRALAGGAGRLFYAEWSAEDGTADDDVDAWYQANPALGIRISEEFVRDEMQALSHSPGEFARERLGIPDPLPSQSGPPAKLDAGQWKDSATRTPVTFVPGACTLAYDVHNGWCSVSISNGTLGASHGEVIEHRKGTGWLPARLVELDQRWQPSAIGLDGGNGEAVAVLGQVREAFDEAKLDPEKLKPLTLGQYKAACGDVVDAITNGRATRPMVEPDQLRSAGEVAAERRIGESWVWDRKCPTPLSPLISWTIARSLLPLKSEPGFWMLST
jgi:hypothetical protein